MHGSLLGRDIEGSISCGVIEGASRAQIGTLILATSGIQLANGYFGTFFSLRITTADFGPSLSGLVLSSYFAGFILGAVCVERIIGKAGHIRAYAGCTGLVAAATSAMPMLVGPLPWLIFRAFIGFGCAGLFVTTESWLNAKADPLERGRVFSIYMVGTFLALAAGQLLIGWTDIEAFAPFNTVAGLFAAALIIVCMARAEAPRVHHYEALPFRRLVGAVPIAILGCVVSGMISSVFYALIPVWMQGEGIEQGTIGLIMLVAVPVVLLFRFRLGASPIAMIVEASWRLSVSGSRRRQYACCFCRIFGRSSCQLLSCSVASCPPCIRSAFPTRTTKCLPIEWLASAAGSF